jgi:16S rRNA (guanine527-N7)-methyltransferase
MPLLLGYLYRFWGPESRAVLHKGREFGEELKSADSDWLYDVLNHRSVTDRDGVILEISNLRPKR